MKNKLILIISLALVAASIAVSIVHSSLTNTPTGFDVVISGLNYDVIYPVYKDLAAVERDGKFGYIDINGHEVVPPLYDNCDFGYLDHFGFEKTQTRYVKRDGKTYIMQTDEADDQRVDLIDKYNWRWVEKDGQQGIINVDGVVVIPIAYDAIGGYINVWLGDDNTAVRDVSFSEGLLRVRNNGKWGFINTANQMVIPLEYDTVMNFEDGLAPVEKNGKWGYIDSNNNIIVPIEYDYVSANEGMIISKKDEKWELLDTIGNVLIPMHLEYDYVSNFSNGLARVEKEGRHGYIDSSGRLVIPLSYNYALDFYMGFAAVMKDEKWGYIDPSGTVVVPLEFTGFKGDFIGAGFTVAWDDQYLCGYIDENGIVAIPPAYDNAYGFHAGLAPVKKDDKWGYINETGETIIPFEYSDAEIFNEDLVSVCKNKKWGCLDTSGHVVIPLKYDSCVRTKQNSNMTLVAKNKKFGILDRQGKTIIPIQCDLITYYDNEIVIVKKGGTWHIIRKTLG